MDTFEAPPLDVASLDKDLQARAAKVRLMHLFPCSWLAEVHTVCVSLAQS